jgi:photosystem II stability/assembly factor-like uncharacterized protein
MTQPTEERGTPAEEAVKAMIARVARRGEMLELGPMDQPTAADRTTRTHARSLSVSLGVIVAVAAVVVLALVLSSGPTGSPSGSASRAGSGSTGLRMELVDSTSSPFESIGGGPQTGDLLCATTSTCYAADNVAPVGLGWEVTHDGGRSWRTLAALPDHRVLMDPVSCPTASTCIGSAAPAQSGGSTPSEAPELAWTRDGGRSWRLDPLPVAHEVTQSTIQRLSCPKPSDCVAFVSNSSSTGASFMTTTDAGSTWTSTSAPAGLMALWSLHCDRGGACIGLVPVGSVQDPNGEAIVALRTTDWGGTWTSTTSPMPFGAGILHMECGDVLHCIMAFPVGAGRSFDIARTSDGGQSWTTEAAPSGWPSIAISLSCSDGANCYLSASDYAPSGYRSAVLEVTHDGGGSWTALELPKVHGEPLALVYPLSCPAAVGCIGVGATAQEFDKPSRLALPPNPTAPPAPNKNRVIISNLRPSAPS